MDGVAARIVDAILSVPIVRMCYCSAPLSEHKFYDDKIYDVQGYVCPGGWGEFRESEASTRAKLRERRIEAVESLLPVGAVDRADGRATGSPAREKGI